MPPKPSEGSKNKQGPSAISKQVLKNTPIPQLVDGPSSTAATPETRKPQPLRSTKVSQKLVLFPPRSVESSTPLSTPAGDLFTTSPPVGYEQRQQQHDLQQRQQQQQQQQQAQSIPRPPLSPLDYPIPVEPELEDEDQAGPFPAVPLPIEWTFGSRTKAEHMTQEERDRANLPRVTAYCTGEGYALKRLQGFLRQYHHVTPRLYDECLYAAYHFPLYTLRPGKDNLLNVRVRSASPRPAPSAESHENEENEMDYDEDHYRSEEILTQHRPYSHHHQHHHQHQHHQQEHQQQRQQQHHYENPHEHEHEHEHEREHERTEHEQSSLGHRSHLTTAEILRQTKSAPTTPITEGAPTSHTMPIEVPPEVPAELSVEVPVEVEQPKPFSGGEAFIFDYGVVVFWNFNRAQELLLLEDLVEYSIQPFRDNPDEDMQIEEMHFEYDFSQPKPRIFNDMITLKSGNHMIKLTLSHGLSQSAVLARYEDIMDKTIEDTKHLPKEMAQTGRLVKNRVEITKTSGQLFSLRMNVNLVSNVLDTPEIFWSEPALQPMYIAIRDYLEIPQRAKILNDRLKVISDLLSMLKDHLTNFGVEYQTLIIIYLIIVAVIVACFEIAVKVLQTMRVL